MVLEAEWGSGHCSGLYSPVLFNKPVEQIPGVGKRVGSVLAENKAPVQAPLGQLCSELVWGAARGKPLLCAPPLTALRAILQPWGRLTVPTHSTCGKTELQKGRVRLAE